MLEKLNNLEQANRTLVNFSQSLSNVQSKVDSIDKRSSDHELFLRVLAYKSIDMEARSRRRNLLFHGLAEVKNERCCELIRNFMEDEMGIDADELYIERAHRLGSLFNARQKSQTPRRPIIVAFYDYASTETVLNASYSLKGSNFSVSRDYPKEIVSARQKLMPLFKSERQNRNNRVSIEFPARLVVNGKTVADQLPDWYPLLQRDRYELANNLNFHPGIGTGYQGCQDFQGDRVTCVNVINSHEQAPNEHMYPHTDYRALNNSRDRIDSNFDQPVRTYAQVVTSRAQQNNNLSTDSGVQVTAANYIPATSSVPNNIPRYAPVNTGNQQPQQTQYGTTSNENNQGGPNTDRNVSVNGTASREQRTYTQL